MLNKKALSATAGAPALLYVEDVFSTYLYTGNNSTQTITNGIDLSGEGGFVWIKARTGTRNHRLVDTARGAGYYMASDTTSGQSFGPTFSSFNTTGFTLASGDSGSNASGDPYVSWTFRKAEKFFDVVTYTGNGNSSQNISHNLGSTPGCVIVKRTDSDSSWKVYHRSVGATKGLNLNGTGAEFTSSTFWNDTAPTSTVFTVGSDFNTNSATYVAYLFAHDAGGFGDSGSDSVIKCGSYTTDGSGFATVTLDWEPQWVLLKRSDSTDGWQIHDVMRGMSNSTYALLAPNTPNAESSGSSGLVVPTATGFKDNQAVGVSATIVYIAIRRGPMKTPEAGTEVFEPVIATPTANQLLTTGFPVDLSINSARSGGSKAAFDRLRGAPYLKPTDNSTETNDSPYLIGFASNTGIIDNFWTSTSSVYWNFRRAPGFFDMVAWTGDGGSSQSITHHLGVAPELIIAKSRTTTNDADWYVFHSGTSTKTYYLNTTGSGTSLGSNVWSPTSTTFTAERTNLGLNNSSVKYISYLFATLAGVSKVGSYTGSGTTKQIDCGFTGGARFVMIKRADSLGSWYVWDTARGIVSGNDPFLLMNSTAAEDTSTDYIDTYSSGFEISSTAPNAINANGGTFIYLAIA